MSLQRRERTDMSLLGRTIRCCAGERQEHAGNLAAGETRQRGADTLNGEGGDDRLSDGAGHDTLSGGGGATHASPLLFESKHASRLTSRLPCGIEPPSNAANGKSAGTRHEAERDTKRHRKGVRRHSLRPPPAESPAHFCSIARFLRAHIRLGSLERGLNPVPHRFRVALLRLVLRWLHINPRILRPPAPSCWFVGSEGNDHTNSGSIPAVAS